MNIPKQLQNPDLRFVLLGKWNYWKNNKTREVKQVNHEQYLEFKENKDWQPCGKMPFETAWATNGYAFDDKKLISHIEQGNNIGIIGGYGRLIILDIDDAKLGEILQDRLNTFTTKTGSGGKHFYFYTDDEISNCVLANEKGELRAKNYQVVVAGCTHPSGVEYEIFRDIPIREITREEINEIIQPYLRPQNTNKTNFSDQPRVEDTSRSGLEYRKVLSLLREGKTDDEINKIMMAYAKWAGSPEQYKIHTLNSAKQYYENNKEKYPQKNNVVIMSKFSPVPYAEKLMSEYEFLYDKHERFWIYDNDSGLWKEDADKFIKNRLRLYLLGDELQKANYCDEIVKYIQDLTWKDIDPTEDTKNLIAFNNCLFDLNTCEILNFDKKYFITNKIKIDLDENFKECPLIDKFFEELVGNENKITLYELIAYCLVRDYPYQKFWILHGIGKNGKSAYLNLIRKVIGDENISVETPQNLSSRPFSIGYLWNKLANISSDIPYTQLENLNTLKELTGNDVVGCERKYKSAFGFRNFAKLIFSGNELPQVNDKSYAFYRRVYILQFNNQIQNPDPNIIDKITTPEQLQGLAWKIIQILKEMKNRNYIFTIDPNEDEMKQLYENLSNPLNRFINECCEQNRDYSVLKFEFADAFNKWASQKGLRIWNERDVNREMAHRYSETRKPTESYDKESQTMQIKHYRAWEGLDFKKSTGITK